MENNIAAEAEKQAGVIESIRDAFLSYIPDIVTAIVIACIGFYLSKFVRKVLGRILQRANYDHTVISFVGQIVYYSGLVATGIAALHALGIPAGSFLTMIGALGVAVGLALKDNMANFASGLLILTFKPFKAGDWITAGSFQGTVTSIQLFNTMIVTNENRAVFIPNSVLTSKEVMNTSYMPTRYIDWVVDIGYENDHHQVIELIRQIFRENPDVLNAEEVAIGIRSFGANSVQIGALPLITNGKYWDVYYSLMSAVKDSFDANGIDIPYPQRVVHMYEHPEERR